MVGSTKWLVCGVVFACAYGCASGATDRRRPFDAGPRADVPSGFDVGPGVDAPGQDSAPGLDTGPGVDVGPGVDTGPGGTDAGTDSGPPADCTVPADCDDGLACNGSETCVGGFCQPGTAVVCNDSVACTTDSCTEPGGLCTFTPVDAMCAPGETCSATGCSSACSESPCRLVSPQCGCAAGTGCYMDVDGVRSCSAAGTAPVGGTCTGTTSCVPGATCAGLGGTASGCQRFCENDAQCTGAGALCILDYTDTMMRPIPAVNACTIHCDPARPTGSGCPSGSTCFLGQEPDGLMRDLTHCTGNPSGSSGQGSFCTSNAQCQAGFICLDPDGFGGQCLHWCKNPPPMGSGISADCPGFWEDCYDLEPAIFIGTTRYGVCWDGF